MADWRQIQARIRKAKTATDPVEKLADLYQRTRDGMVAFELARWHENAGQNAEAAKWYTSAAEHFRRAQWRVKAEEALARLGAPIPPPAAGAETPRVAKRADAAEPLASEPIPASPYVPFSENQPVLDERDEMNDEESESVEEVQAAEMTTSGAGSTQGAPQEAPATGKKRRRRGRRGGRGRRRATTGSATAGAAAGASVSTPERTPAVTGVRHSAPAVAAPQIQESERTPEREYTREPASYAPAAAAPSAGAAWQSRARAGEPALASRMAQLESQLRRLLACPMCALDEADQAPAGPGVLLLSDSDQVTHYYIEACQTLRIGVGNLLRGARGSKGGVRLKPEMADNLGIAESRVTKYMKDHCAVRWLQLDEGAGELAHFAMALLRPVVKE